MVNNHNGWHVLYVKSQHEKKVHDLLSKVSIESFLPTVKTVVQWSDRKKTIVKPLFPSYLFVKIYSSLDFYRVLGVSGACSYVHFGEQHAKITEKEINNIKILLGANDLSDVKTTNHLLSVGDLTIVKEGVLTGLECEVIRIQKEKISVRFDVKSLRQNITATLPASYLN